MGSKKKFMLAGDVGGTKTSVAIYAKEAGLHAPLLEATFPSTAYSGLAELLKGFLAQTDLQVARACFGVAGPVVNGQARITNLPWVLDEAQLAADLGLDSFTLLNDLVAVASGVPFLEPADVYTLHPGQAQAGGALAVVAPGTGLGEGYLTWNGKKYRAYASEGGHCDFAPTNALEIDLLRYLQAKFGRVSCERVCSGLGIPNIYAFLRDRGYAEEPAWLAEQLSVAPDPNPVIVPAALDPERPCELCRKTLEVFVTILGAEAGNMALRVLATGGVYLGGGVPTHILAALDSDNFRTAFRNKGRLSSLLEQIPVYVILHPKIALLGAAARGFGL
ncbi:MAG TPA: glucokinase [Anaerolineae bacterium]|nr:glucokinase [Anaerolineae bacterium]HQH39353.1 glucokinase [Anaerolineae bacterium]